MDFDFGLWNYIDAGKYPFSSEKLVKEWQELGITVGCSFVTDGRKECLEKVKELLFYAGEAGIKVFVYDKRVFWKNYRENGEERYKKEVKNALGDYGKYPCVKGFILCDEPDKKSLPSVGKALDVFRSLTRLTPFVNFSWSDSRGKEYGSREKYIDALSEFAKGRLDFIANDRYSCMHARDYEEDFQKTGIDRFFADLNMFGKVAANCGLPYWTSLLSVGHWMFRTPSESDIRWQLSVSFAHGVNGVQWFFINQHREADDYYSYPVDIYGERTPLFDAIKRQSRIFRDKVVKKLEGYNAEKTWHITTSYGNTPLLKREDCDLFVYGDHRGDGILTLFKKGENKSCLLVNNDQKYPELFHIEFNRHPERNYYTWLDAGGTHIINI